MDKDHVTKEEFLLEYYGMLSRELGNPPAEGRKRYFSDNPNDIFECIQFSIDNKVPAFISVQPRESFDKVRLPTNHKITEPVNVPLTELTTIFSMKPQNV